MTPDLRALIDEVEKALEPFAAFGDVFTKADKFDDSPWAKYADDFEIQLGASRLYGWTIKVGDLRRSVKALAALRAYAAKEES